MTNPEQVLMSYLLHTRHSASIGGDDAQVAQHTSRVALLRSGHSKQALALGRASKRQSRTRGGGRSRGGAKR